MNNDARMANLNQCHKKEYVVGVNYFNGWWRPLPNKYMVNGRDWRIEYPERIPLLGCYNDQRTLDAEIIAASSHGVDFFLMLWYVNKNPVRNVHGAYLNECLDMFVSSPERNRMCFAIEYCNHPPHEIYDDSLWDECCREWAQYMSHPFYLRIGRKAFFKVHGLNYLLMQSGSVLNARKRVEKLREVARNEGVGELLIGAGVVVRENLTEDIIELAKSFDFFASYGDLPCLPKKDEDYPYELLKDESIYGWKRFSKLEVLPYMPYVMTGWNPKPWGDKRPSFVLPDAEQWKNMLLCVKSALDGNKQLRLPDTNHSGLKIFNIYAWNEFGEGGIVAPTLGDKWIKLEIIREVFGS